jgi:hypothetical protein
VIVINHDDDIRLRFGHPFLGRLIPLEQRRPIRFAGFTVVDGGATGAVDFPPLRSIYG